MRRPRRALRRIGAGSLDLVSAVAGSPRARSTHGEIRRHPPSITEGLAQLIAREPTTGDADGDDVSPIFILSAGWRSGSTLLQRLVVSDPSVIIWGEPYDLCCTVQRLAESVAAFRASWPPPEYLLDHRRDTLAVEWVANLYPSLQDLKAAHRAMLDRLFAAPALTMGYRRWGVKEVRLGADHAFYLRWLYPRAKFLLLYRDPFAAWASYRSRGRKWYARWPDQPVFTPTRFGRLWSQLARSYLDHHGRLDARMLSYEALATGRADFQAIAEYLGIDMDPGVLNHRVGSSARDGKPLLIPRVERWLLTRAVTPVARELGYCH